MSTTTSEPAVRGRHSPHERALRNGLGALALVNLVIGVWMVVAPASFVDNVGPFGEPNDHYVRDLATWYLSYAGVLTVAVGTRSWRVPVLVFGVAQGVLHSSTTSSTSATPIRSAWDLQHRLARRADRRDALAALDGARRRGTGDGAMRVFVAGATGAIGKPLLDRLQDAGHQVAALARSDAKARALRERGVEPHVADALDPAALARAVSHARPEVVVNQLTALPANIDPRKYEQALGPTNVLRREAGPALARALPKPGPPDRRPERLLHARPVGADGPRRGRAAVPRSAEAGPRGGHRDDDARAGDARHAGDRGRRAALRLLLRRRAVLAQRRDAKEIARRRMPVVGSGEGRFSFIHVEDAADATVAALDHGAPGVYNVTDDEPALQREWVREVARLIGAPKPMHVPLWLARLAAGPMARGAVELRGASNAKARRELGWAPARPDWRAGFAEEFGAGETARA